MAKTGAVSPIELGDGRFVYDAFLCRHDYVGMVAPYWCRPAFDGLDLRVDDESAEWFVLPDSRQFTMSLLAKIPRSFRRSWFVHLRLGAAIRQFVARESESGGRLAMVTMVRDDAPYLAEWIAHHISLGFEHFYIYNHTSIPAITAVLRGFGEWVTEIPWQGPYSRESAWQEPFLSPDSHCYTQCPQMMHAALKYGDHWDWMGFFDADEFLCPMTDVGIHEILAAAEEHAYGEVPFVRTAALEVKGKWFGTSGHATLAEGSIRENYTHCERGHTCGPKCFVQPHAVTGTAIHYWDVLGQTARLPDNLLRFNHYRAISPYKNRVGPSFDDDWTNETSDTRLLDVLTPQWPT